MTVREPMSPELEFLRVELRQAIARELEAPVPAAGSTDGSRSWRASRPLRASRPARRALILAATVSSVAVLAVAGASAAGIEWPSASPEPEVMAPEAMDDHQVVTRADGTPGGTVAQFQGDIAPMPLGATRLALNEARDPRDSKPSLVTHPRPGAYVLEIPRFDETTDSAGLGAEPTIPSIDYVLVDRSSGRSLELPDPITGERWILFPGGSSVPPTARPGYLSEDVMVRHLPAMSDDGLACFRTRYTGSYAQVVSSEGRWRQTQQMERALTACRSHAGVLPEIPGGYSQTGLMTFAPIDEVGVAANLTDAMELRMSVAFTAGSKWVNTYDPPVS